MKFYCGDHGLMVGPGICMLQLSVVEVCPWLQKLAPSLEYPGVRPKQGGYGVLILLLLLGESASSWLLCPSEQVTSRIPSSSLLLIELLEPLCVLAPGYLGLALLPLQLPQPRLVLYVHLDVLHTRIVPGWLSGSRGPRVLVRPSLALKFFVSLL